MKKSRPNLCRFPGTVPPESVIEFAESVSRTARKIVETSQVIEFDDNQ